MSGIGFRIDIDDETVQAALAGLEHKGQDMTPAMDDIGAAMVASTINRFERGVSPGGTAWVPSFRAILQSGQTLVDQGHLRGSITHNPERDAVEWGSNLIYARIYQLGGRIRAKNKPFLVFRLADGSVVKAREVQMPARPYLGVDEDDRAEIPAILTDFFAEGFE